MYLVESSCHNIKGMPFVVGRKFSHKSSPLSIILILQMPYVSALFYLNEERDWQDLSTTHKAVVFNHEVASSQLLRFRKCCRLVEIKFIRIVLLRSWKLGRDYVRLSCFQYYSDFINDVNYSNSLHNYNKKIPKLILNNNILNNSSYIVFHSLKLLSIQ
ncbi:Protein of unknown function [Gryllus bimaculatus]|nr:Protein of unknown function [Gryllus bimaculatus]